MSSTKENACKAAGTSCGTPAGWRYGGRCVRCRLAHNDETNRYRGLRPAQRQAVLEALNGGASAKEAAAAVGKTLTALGHVARTDGELHAALMGQPVGVQRAARQADFLALLIRAGGNVPEACRLGGIDPDVVAQWAEEDPTYSRVQSVFLRWVRPMRVKKRRDPVTEEELDRAAQLLESGSSIAAAARAVGLTHAGLIYASERHSRLRAALPERKNGTRGGRPSRLTEEVEEEFRRLWARGASYRVIASALGISPPTVVAWRSKLGLPERSPKAAW